MVGDDINIPDITPKIAIVFSLSLSPKETTSCVTHLATAAARNYCKLLMGFSRWRLLLLSSPYCTVHFVGHSIRHKFISTLVIRGHSSPARSILLNQFWWTGTCSPREKRWITGNAVFMDELWQNPIEFIFYLTKSATNRFDGFGSMRRFSWLVRYEPRRVRFILFVDNRLI